MFHLQAAMAKAYKEGLGADFTLLCEGETKRVHSFILMARSPFFEAKINRWMGEEKREMVLEDCDLFTFDIIVNFMYGIDIPPNMKYNSGKLRNLLKVSDRFQMSDLKAELEVLICKTLTEENLTELCNLGERFDCKRLIRACAKLMAEKGCTMSEDDVKELPKVASACINAFAKKRKAEEKGKKSEKQTKSRFFSSPQYSPHYDSSPQYSP